jgi:hypothetical protein
VIKPIRSASTFVVSIEQQCSLPHRSLGAGLRKSGCRDYRDRTSACESPSIRGVMGLCWLYRRREASVMQAVRGVRTA